MPAGLRAIGVQSIRGLRTSVSSKVTLKRCLLLSATPTQGLPRCSMVWCTTNSHGHR